MNVIKDQEAGIRARRMAIHIPNSEQEDVVPLFKLEDGVASSSAGLICAKNAGMSDAVIGRAKQIIHAMRAKKSIQPVAEAMHDIPQFSDEEKEMLLYFSSVESWENASDDQLRILIQKVSKAMNS
jgi:DNA mismatch repair protein MSH5